jgi:tyrosine-protein phosphatase SIW14
MRSTTPLLLGIATVILSAGSSKAAAPEVPGIPNFHQVTDRIFRGGQPENESWTHLSKLGVRTVLDLRRPGEHSTAAESIAVCAAGMHYLNFPMNGFDTPSAEQLAVPLAMLEGDSPVFVHCKQGRDRTGTVIAAYRISHQGWENEKALAEAKSLGLHWYESGMRKFIASYRVMSPGAAAGQHLADAKVPADSTQANRAR